MTFEYVILPEKRCIAIRYSGALTLSEVVTTTEKLWADPLYDKTYNGITDLTRAVSEGTTDHIRPMVDFFKRPETSAGRWGVILTEPKLVALTLLFKSLSFSKPWIEVFASWEAACTFLGKEIPKSIFDQKPGTT